MNNSATLTLRFPVHQPSKADRCREKMKLWNKRIRGRWKLPRVRNVLSCEKGKKMRQTYAISSQYDSVLCPLGLHMSQTIFKSKIIRYKVAHTHIFAHTRQIIQQIQWRRRQNDTIWCFVCIWSAKMSFHSAYEMRFLLFLPFNWLIFSFI